MKKTKIIYWIATGLLLLVMAYSGVVGILKTQDSMKIMEGVLGYPPYFGPFLGVAKVLGVIALLVPGFPRVKEWAYAGFAFDLVGATWSEIGSGKVPAPGVAVMVIWFVLFIVSYINYHKIYGTVGKAAA